MESLYPVLEKSHYRVVLYSPDGYVLYRIGRPEDSRCPRRSPARAAGAMADIVYDDHWFGPPWREPEVAVAEFSSSGAADLLARAGGE